MFVHLYGFPPTLDPEKEREKLREIKLKDAICLFRGSEITSKKVSLEKREKEKKTETFLLTFLLFQNKRNLI